MAVTVRERTLPSGDSHWQVDIRVRLTDGTTHRERHKAPGSTRAQALRWARQREAHILRHGPQGKESTKKKQAKPRPVVPTFAEFAPRFLQDHVVANRLSPTTRRDYENTIKHHLNPVLGDIRLDRLERRGEHVLTNDRGRHLTPNSLVRRLRVAQRHAGLAPCGPHILRHTFCSHLVLRGVHVRTIQKLAGHAELSTTEVYMHLVSEAEDDAIRRLRGEDDEE